MEKHKINVKYTICDFHTGEIYRTDTICYVRGFTNWKTKFNLVVGVLSWFLSSSFDGKASVLQLCRYEELRQIDLPF